MKKALLITSLILLVGCTNEENRNMKNAERLSNRNRTQQEYYDNGYSDFGVRYYQDVLDMPLGDANDYYEKNFRNVKSDIEEFLDKSGAGFKMDIQNEAYRRYVANDLEYGMIGNNPETYLNYDEFQAYRTFVQRYDNFFKNGQIGVYDEKIRRGNMAKNDYDNLRRISPRT
ncbi:hypothetical protein RJG79_00495 [Mycoplasmatota bacterium WC44]